MSQLEDEPFTNDEMPDPYVLDLIEGLRTQKAALLVALEEISNGPLGPMSYQERFLWAQGRARAAIAAAKKEGK